MQTYSINIGLPTEATSYPLILGGSYSSLAYTYIDEILNKLQDNESKLVEPWDLRDAILSLWSSTPFKETTTSGGSYIGLDSNNPSDRDIKNKIYIGKRAFSGTYSYTQFHNIMNDSLLLSDVDLFLFNTKNDNTSQTSTRISILAGNNLSIHEDAPYIGAQLVSGTTQSLSLDIVNLSPFGGDINILSDDSVESPGYTSSVYVNNIKFPTPIQNSASASTYKVLFSDNNDLYWDNIELPVLEYIGNTGSELNIYGGPVSVNPLNINNYSLELDDDRQASFEVGDIKFGATFDNIAISEILRRIIYEYLPPTCSIKIIGTFESGYTEVGTYPLPELEYKINKKTLPTIPTSLSNMIPGIYAPVTNPQYTTVTSTSDGVVISPITATSTEFKITVSDGIQSSSASTTLTGIYPYFYGFSSIPTMNSIGLAGLTKLVKEKSDQTVDITGNGNLYFVYDFDYGTLSNIYDNIGNTVSGSFSYTVETLSSPTGLWAGKQFYVYQWNGLSQIGPPSVNYQFVY